MLHRPVEPAAVIVHVDFKFPISERCVRCRTDSLLQSRVALLTPALGTRKHVRIRGLAKLKSFSSLSWKRLYLEALKTSERNNLTGLVQAAELAIFERAKELTDLPEHRQERNELSLACTDLLAVKTQKLGWPALLPAKTTLALDKRKDRTS